MSQHDTPSEAPRDPEPDGARSDEPKRRLHRRSHRADPTRVRRDVQRPDGRRQRQTSRTAWLDALVADVRYGSRVLRRSPAFTLVAALCIALGVAANATMFAVVNAALLRPIPGAHAERLVRIYMNQDNPFTWDELDWFREHTTMFEHIVGERSSALALRTAGSDGAERVRVSYATQGFFGALGVRMALGRSFDGDDRGGHRMRAIWAIGGLVVGAVSSELPMLRLTATPRSQGATGPPSPLRSAEIRRRA